jgi:hypothetical protein
VGKRGGRLLKYYPLFIILKKVNGKGFPCLLAQAGRRCNRSRVTCNLLSKGKYTSEVLLNE